MAYRALVLVGLTAAMLWSTTTVAGDLGERYSRSVQRAYEEVLDDVKFAIAEHNFRITGGNEVGAAIAKRGHESFQRSDIVHFCNLEHARRFLEVAPDFLLHMPCRVVVYEVGDKVVVETRLLPQDQRVTEPSEMVNQILRSIVDYATEP